VLIAIAAHADRHGRAFPSLARISEMTGIDRRGLHREIAALVTAELLRVERRRDSAGDPASNIYTIVLDQGVSSQEATPIAPPRDTVSSHRATPGVVSPHDLTDQYGTDHRTRAQQAARAREPLSRDSASEFENFWQVYPSRRPHANPRKPAQQAFEEAIKRGVDPAAIIRGAANYAAVIAAEHTEPRYIAQAKTWLTEERWTEYQQQPEPPRLRVGMN
jgi:hypothetical protein